MSANTSSRKVVFITGCSNGGIGGALAEEFASKGCIVYASARSLQSMSELTHSGIHKLIVEVTSNASCKLAVDAIYAEAGRIDVFISNAGVACIGPVLDVSLETAQNVLDTNLFGTIRLVNLIVPRMAKRHSGLIVPIGSISGELGPPFSGIYNASKAALHAYAETLAVECKPLDLNVMLIIPGAIKSNIANNQAKKYSAPEDSLYKNFATQISRRMFISQGENSMDTHAFAEFVVKNAMASHPPPTITAGGSVMIWWFLKWLPRPMAMNILWERFSKL